MSTISDYYSFVNFSNANNTKNQKQADSEEVSKNQSFADTLAQTNNTTRSENTVNKDDSTSKVNLVSFIESLQKLLEKYKQSEENTDDSFSLTKDDLHQMIDSLPSDNSEEVDVSSTKTNTLTTEEKLLPF
jgi:hypothetical protein